MTNLTMFDAVNIANIPASAQIVAGYVGGAWPTFVDLRKRFPNALHVSIAVSAKEVALVLDVEHGDATPEQAPAWATRMRTLGNDPIVYTSKSQWPVVQSQFSTQHVAQPHYWIADWTGVEHLVAGSVATQWADGSATYPGLAKWCDTSFVSHALPRIIKQHLPTPKGTTTMISISPQLKAAFLSIENAVRKTGVWAVFVNDFTKTVHMSPTTQAIFTSIAGILLAIDHQNAKTNPPTPAA